MRLNLSHIKGVQMVSFTKYFTALLLVLISSASWSQDGASTTKLEKHILVMKLEPQMRTRFQELANTFAIQGTDAVAELISDDMKQPQMREQWQTFAQSMEPTIVDIEIHPNEAKAIEWMNQRFQTMGLNNLSFRGIENSSLADPTALRDEEIKSKKWLRYLAGPGVAMAATIYGLPKGSELMGSDYLLLILPAAGVGVTTVLLELQFAWPWLNDHFWKHVWKFGGKVFGRVTNTFVNFLYGMSLYGSGVGAAMLPTLWGGSPIGFEHLSFEQAVIAAAIGGVTFHLAMGQFQTDIAVEEERGSISGKERYSLETSGVVINNGGRVINWILPGSWGVWAQSSFFILKTFPQLLKTNLSHWLKDRKVHRQLNPEKAPKATVLERCANALAGLELINPPKLKK